jgi:hypothetical protein
MAKSADSGKDFIRQDGVAHIATTYGEDGHVVVDLPETPERGPRL